MIKRPGICLLTKSVKRAFKINEMGDYLKHAFIEHPVVGVDWCGGGGGGY